MDDRRGIRVFLAGAGVALALAVMPGVAISQSSSTGSGAEATTQKIDDASLEKAAKAYIAVRHITDDTKQRLARTQDSSEQQQITSQAEAQKLDVVRQEGLQPKLYNQILMTVQNDPNLQQKFLSIVNSQGAGG